MTKQKRTRKKRRKRRTIDEGKKETELINDMTKEIGGGRTRTLVQQNSHH